MMEAGWFNFQNWLCIHGEYSLGLVGVWIATETNFTLEKGR